MAAKLLEKKSQKLIKETGNVRHWVYYRCTHFKPCSQKGCTREEVIDEQIVNLLSRLSLGTNTTQWLKDKLKESHQDEVKFREDSLRSLNNTFVQVRNRLDKIYDDKLDGLIDDETYHRKREELLTQQADLTNQIKLHTLADEKYVDFGSLILDVANRASEIYQVRKPDEKRYLCNFVFSNLKKRLIYQPKVNIFLKMSSLAPIIGDYSDLASFLTNDQIITTLYNKLFNLSPPGI